jgi:methyl-accepting chemotaxis protein
MFKLSLKKQLIAASFLWSFILILMGAFIFYSQNLQQTALNKIEHAKTLSDTYDFASRSIVNLESVLRGYLLTNDESLLSAFKNSENGLENRLKEAQKTYEGTPEIQKSFAELASLSKSWTEKFAHEQIQARKRLTRGSLSVDDFASEFKLSEGTKVIAAYNKIALSGLALENQKISDLNNEQSLAYSRVKFSLAFGIPATILIGLILMIYIINRTHQTIEDFINGLFMTATAMDGASRSMLANSTTLAQANTETSTSTQTTAAAIGEIHSMTVSNTKSSEKALDTAVDCLKLAIKGQETMHAVRLSIETIDQSSEKMMSAVSDNNSKLAKISQLMTEINAKTNVINDIAFQTKLLSFNASVEAARAGENGKGFAVVAEEIGNLAKMSGDAAREISTLLTDSSNRVQVIVKETTSSMDSITHEVREKISAGTEKSTEGYVIVTELLKGVGTVHEIMNGICQACNEQDAGINQVNNAIQQIEESLMSQTNLANRYVSTAEQLQEQTEKIDGQVADLRALFGVDRSVSTHADQDDDGITWTDDGSFSGSDAA